MIDEIPRISKMLAMLLPKMLPMAISELPLKLERTLMINSGAEVPKEITVSPITRSETFSLFAIDEAPETIRSAPLIKKTNPTTKRI